MFFYYFDLDELKAEPPEDWGDEERGDGAVDLLPFDG